VPPLRKKKAAIQESNHPRQAKTRDQWRNAVLVQPKLHEGEEEQALQAASGLHHPRCVEVDEHMYEKIMKNGESMRA
jgi:hypothetical protein